MLIDLDNVADAHNSCIDKIYEYDYYVSLLESLEIPENPTPVDICSFWNEFWNLLPDSNAIRRQPFYLICDLAEGSYLEDETE